MVDKETCTQKPLEVKVLSCTAEFYIAVQKRNISAYQVIPLEVSYYADHPSIDELKYQARIFGCEVITDIRQIDSKGFHRFLFGTGLELLTEDEIKAGEEG
jgi:hypothetical protein